MAPIQAELEETMEVLIVLSLVVLITIGVVLLREFKTIHLLGWFKNSEQAEKKDHRQDKVI